MIRWTDDLAGFHRKELNARMTRLLIPRTALARKAGVSRTQLQEFLDYDNKVNPSVGWLQRVHMAVDAWEG